MSVLYMTTKVYNDYAGRLGIPSKTWPRVKIPERYIQDKSKSDVLAKGLVCLQVAWLIIQGVGRAANGLPIALLEIHVLAHVAYALMLYGIWFKKPFNIQEATMVDTSQFGDELAVNAAVKPRRWGNKYRHSIPT
ncbi:hypothetical protein F5B17DRAFT_360450 [Nemania serpens]|nr:hypothetical protein F5B17DRAFT_360450 [Nemania serpens]